MHGLGRWVCLYKRIEFSGQDPYIMPYVLRGSVAGDGGYYTAHHLRCSLIDQLYLDRRR